MKKVGSYLLLAVIAVAFMAVRAEEASARSQWSKAFLKKVDPKFEMTFKSKKCFLCHSPEKVDGKASKKNRNEYGLALSNAKGADDKLLLGKEKYDELKVVTPKEAKDKAFDEAFFKAFEVAGKVKSSDGKTFAEKIKGGKLPSADDKIAK